MESSEKKSMRVQNLMYPNAQICTECNMYFRLAEGTEYVYVRDQIIFHRSFTAVFFNTYFNSFSIGKWKKYTNIENVSLTLRLKGQFTVTLWREENVIGNNVQEIVREELCTSETEKQFTIEFKSVHASGIYYFCINAIQPGSVYYGGYYSVIYKERPSPVKLGISICHFKKEAYVRTNMEAICEYLKTYPDFADNLEVFISDNGQTLTRQDAPYDFVHIFKNKNAGGAGGFTRCIMEIQRANSNGDDITHVLLMDDDLTFEPEIFFRTWAFLSHLKKAYSRFYFSGLMNRLDHKNIQHENGALWNGGNFISLKPNFDMNDFSNVLFNDCVDETVEFAPWWYCCIPIGITENNLPIPIFYREDDSEYGMRSAEGIISMNGICVWHEPFENKFVPFVCYYHARNLHIVNALHHPEYGKQHLLKYTYGEVRRELYYMRYRIADLYLRAAEDFMKGIDWLKKTDTVELHRQIVQTGYIMQDINDIKEMPFIYGKYAENFNRPPLTKWKQRIWDHSCCGHLIHSTRDVWVPIAPGKVRPEMFVKAKRAYHFDQNARRGFVTVRSFREYRRVMKRFAALEKIVNKKYDMVANEYRNRLKEITSTEFWNTYLGI